MKNIKIFSLCIFLVLTMSGCNLSDVFNALNKDNPTPYVDPVTGKDGYNGNTEVTLPQIDPSGVNYLKSFTTNQGACRFNFEINGNKLEISGELYDDIYKYLIVMFDRDNNNQNKMPAVNRQFSSQFSIPEGKSSMIVEVYGGREEYGTFESIILDYVIIKKVGEDFNFVKSPVYDSNVLLYTQPKDVNEFLKPTNRIQSDDPEIVSLASDITQQCNSDYEKLKAIHDWVAENIYYDFDVLTTGNFENMDARGVYNSKRGVCEGYANLFAALARSQQIPCLVQGGYALGIDTNKEWNSSNVNITDGNHAWNEAYVDGRWIIIDSTWDSQNEYRGGSYTKGNYVANLYFDSDMEFFSMSHKLLC